MTQSTQKDGIAMGLETTVDKWVKQARERGFLQPIERIGKENKVSTPKVGSKATPKARKENK